MPVKSRPASEPLTNLIKIFLERLWSQAPLRGNRMFRSHISQHDRWADRSGGQLPSLTQDPVSVLRQPLLRGGRSPRITRFGSNWQTDRTHQGVLQARRWAGPKKTSAEFE